MADRLHKTLEEIDRMTVEEFNGWMVYLATLDEERKKRQRT